MRGTALFSGELERDFEGWEFWLCCQLEAVRGEHNHAPKEKSIQATGAEGSTDQREVDGSGKVYLESERLLCNT